MESKMIWCSHFGMQFDVFSKSSIQNWKTCFLLSIGNWWVCHLRQLLRVCWFMVVRKESWKVKKIYNFDKCECALRQFGSVLESELDDTKIFVHSLKKKLLSIHVWNGYNESTAIDCRLIKPFHTLNHKFGWFFTAIHKSVDEMIRITIWCFEMRHFNVSNWMTLAETMQTITCIFSQQTTKSPPA